MAAFSAWPTAFFAGLLLLMLMMLPSGTHAFVQNFTQWAEASTVNGSLHSVRLHNINGSTVMSLTGMRTIAGNDTSFFFSTSNVSEFDNPNVMTGFSHDFASSAVDILLGAVPDPVNQSEFVAVSKNHAAASGTSPTIVRVRPSTSSFVRSSMQQPWPVIDDSAQGSTFLELPDNRVFWGGDFNSPKTAFVAEFNATNHDFTPTGVVVNAGLGIQIQPRYRALARHPSNPNLIYAGGRDDPNNTHSGAKFCAEIREVDVTVPGNPTLTANRWTDCNYTTEAQVMDIAEDATTDRLVVALRDHAALGGEFLSFNTTANLSAAGPQCRRTTAADSLATDYWHLVAVSPSGGTAYTVGANGAELIVAMYNSTSCDLIGHDTTTVSTDIAKLWELVVDEERNQLFVVGELVGTYQLGYTITLTTPAPTAAPTASPTLAPTTPPTLAPTTTPSSAPSSAPTSRPEVLSAIVTAASRVSACTDLDLDASLSTSSDGSTLDYSWALDTTTSTNTSACSKVFDHPNQPGPFLTVPATDLMICLDTNPSVSVTVQLTLDSTGSAAPVTTTVQVEVSSEVNAVPVVTIVGPASLATQRSDAVSLSASVDVSYPPACAGLANVTATQFAWEVYRRVDAADTSILSYVGTARPSQIMPAPADALLPWATTFAGGRIVVVDAHALNLTMGANGPGSGHFGANSVNDTHYVLRAIATVNASLPSGNVGTSNSSADVRVFVHPTPLQANSIGGSFRQVQASSAVLLEAVVVDPDIVVAGGGSRSRVQRMELEWSLGAPVATTDLTSNALYDSVIVQNDYVVRANVTVPPTAGTVTATLTFSSSILQPSNVANSPILALFNRTKTVSFTLNVSSTPKPTPTASLVRNSIAWQRVLPHGKVNAHERVAIETEAVDALAGDTIAWTVEPALNLSKHALSPITQTSNIFIVGPGTSGASGSGGATNYLSEGSTYTFRCTATDGVTGKSGIASIEVLVNHAPTAGALSVVPATGGLAFESTITSTTSSWHDVDGDIPLQFIFAYRYADASEATSSPLAQRAADTSLEHTLPARTPTGDSLVVIVTAVDQMGGLDRVSQAVSVVGAAATPAELVGTLTSDAQNQLNDFNDPMAATVLASALATTLDEVADDATVSQAQTDVLGLVESSFIALGDANDASSLSLQASTLQTVTKHSDSLDSGTRLQALNLAASILGQTRSSTAVADADALVSTVESVVETFAHVLENNGLVPNSAADDVADDAAGDDGDDGAATDDDVNQLTYAEAVAASEQIADSIQSTAQTLMAQLLVGGERELTITTDGIAVLTWELYASDMQADIDLRVGDYAFHVPQSTLSLVEASAPTSCDGQNIGLFATAYDSAANLYAHTDPPALDDIGHANESELNTSASSIVGEGVGGLTFLSCDGTEIEISNPTDPFRVEVPLYAGDLGVAALALVDSTTGDDDAVLPGGTFVLVDNSSRSSLPQKSANSTCTEDHLAYTQCLGADGISEVTFTTKCPKDATAMSVVCPVHWVLAECVFWRWEDDADDDAATSSRWSGTGCTATRVYEDTQTSGAVVMECECSHLTDFSGAGEKYGLQAEETIMGTKNIDEASVRENPGIIVLLGALWVAYLWTLYTGKALDKQADREQLKMLRRADMSEAAHDNDGDYLDDVDEEGYSDDDSDDEAAQEAHARGVAVPAGAHGDDAAAHTSDSIEAAIGDDLLGDSARGSGSGSGTADSQHVGGGSFAFGDLQLGNVAEQDGANGDTHTSTNDDGEHSPRHLQAAIRLRSTRSPRGLVVDTTRSALHGTDSSVGDGRPGLSIAVNESPREPGSARRPGSGREPGSARRPGSGREPGSARTPRSPNVIADLMLPRNMAAQNMRNLARANSSRRQMSSRSLRSDGSSHSPRTQNDSDSPHFSALHGIAHPYAEAWNSLRRQSTMRGGGIGAPRRFEFARGAGTPRSTRSDRSSEDEEVPQQSFAGLLCSSYMAWLKEEHPIIGLLNREKTKFLGLRFRYRATILFCEVLTLLFLAALLYERQLLHEEWQKAFDENDTRALIAQLLESIWEAMIAALIWVPVSYVLYHGFKSVCSARVSAVAFGESVFLQRDELLKVDPWGLPLAEVYSLLVRLEALRKVCKAEQRILEHEQAANDDDSIPDGEGSTGGTGGTQGDGELVASFKAKVQTPILMQLGIVRRAYAHKQAQFEQDLAVAYARAVTGGSLCGRWMARREVKEAKEEKEKEKRHRAYLDSLTYEQRELYLADHILLNNLDAQGCWGSVKAGVYKSLVMDSGNYVGYRSYPWRKLVVLTLIGIYMLFATFFTLSFALQRGSQATQRALAALVLSLILDLVVIAPLGIAIYRAIAPLLVARTMTKDIIEAKESAAVNAGRSTRDLLESVLKSEKEKRRALESHYESGGEVNAVRNQMHMMARSNSDSPMANSQRFDMIESPMLRRGRSGRLGSGSSPQPQRTKSVDSGEVPSPVSPRTRLRRIRRESLWAEQGGRSTENPLTSPRAASRLAQEREMRKQEHDRIRAMIHERSKMFSAGRLAGADGVPARASSADGAIEMQERSDGTTALPAGVPRAQSPLTAYPHLQDGLPRPPADGSPSFALDSHGGASADGETAEAHDGGHHGEGAAASLLTINMVAQHTAATSPPASPGLPSCATVGVAGLGAADGIEFSSEYFAKRRAARGFHEPLVEQSSLLVTTKRLVNHLWTRGQQRRQRRDGGGGHGGASFHSGGSRGGRADASEHGIDANGDDDDDDDDDDEDDDESLEGGTFAIRNVNATPTAFSFMDLDLLAADDDMDEEEKRIMRQAAATGISVLPTRRITPAEDMRVAMGLASKSPTQCASRASEDANSSSNSRAGPDRSSSSSPRFGASNGGADRRGTRASDQGRPSGANFSRPSGVSLATQMSFKTSRRDLLQSTTPRGRSSSQCAGGTPRDPSSTRGAAGRSASVDNPERVQPRSGWGGFGTPPQPVPERPSNLSGASRDSDSHI